MDSFVHSFLFEFISVPIDFPPFRAGAKKIDWLEEKKIDFHALSKRLTKSY